MEIEDSYKLVILKDWFRTFRFFEYRKTSRIHSGDDPSGKPLSGILPTILILLWLVSFALQSVVVNNEQRSVTLTFASWAVSDQVSPTQSDIFLFIGIGLTLIVLCLLLIVIVWRLHFMCEICSCIMLCSTIALVIIRSYQQTEQNLEEGYSLYLAFVSVQFVTAGLIGDVVTYYLWSAYLLPAILRFQWSQLQHKNRGALNFPYFRLFSFLAFSILVFPLWIMIIGSYILLFLLQLAGLPFVGRDAFEFLTLNENAWSMDLLAYERSESPGGGEVLHIQVHYRFATWRTFLTPFLPVTGATFDYVGEVDNTGLPHGRGTWRDFEVGKGEFLKGCWEHGLPVAPFVSREQSNFGGTFAATRIGFAYMQNCPFDSKAGGVQFRPDGLTFGVSSTEGSISGRWYREYPNSGTFLTPLDKCSFTDMWSLMMAGRVYEERDADVDASDHGPNLTVSPNNGYWMRDRDHPWEEEHFLGSGDFKDEYIRSADMPSNFPRPHLQSLRSGVTANSAVEVLLFVPGFNSTLLSALEIIGQMFLLTAIPDHIVPVVFKWPGGNLLSFYEAQEVCAGAEIVSLFDDLVTELYATGQVGRIHCLGHSMGCRALVNCLTTSRFTSFGQIILAQPEEDSNHFRSHCGLIAAHVQNVTVYVNRGDLALFGAEFFNRSFVGSSDRKQCAVCCGCLGHSEGSLGRASDGPFVDWSGQVQQGLDVIDTSSIHSNVHEIKHSFFHLSRETLDDIRAILVDGLPACERKGRLVLRDKDCAGTSSSNIFDVCVTPSRWR